MIVNEDYRYIEIHNLFSVHNAHSPGEKLALKNKIHNDHVGLLKTAVGQIYMIIILASLSCVH